MTGFTAQIVDRYNTARSATLITSPEISEKDARAAARAACGRLADTTGSGWMVVDFYGTPPARTLSHDAQAVYRDLAAAIAAGAKREGELHHTAGRLVAAQAGLLSDAQRAVLEPLVSAALEAARAE
jgi:hypothetical protein